MNKKILIALMLMAVSMAGCSLKSNTAGQPDSGNAGNFGPDRRPDFSQPDRQADITGLVKSIEGNQVTIIKIDRPQRNASSTGEQAAGTQNGTRTQNGGMTRTFSGTGGGMMMGGGPGGRPGEQSEETRAQMLEALKAMSTGEVTVTIPVGIQILKPDTAEANKQPSMSEAGLTDIKADKMVNIWLDESIADKKVASFVLITR